jgi:hypothetical protein
VFDLIVQCLITCDVNTEVIATTSLSVSASHSDSDSVSDGDSDSGSDSATIASAVIVSTVATIQGLQQQSSGVELRTQDQVERSNLQTVTLPILMHSFVRYACVNVV